MSNHDAFKTGAGYGSNNQRLPETRNLPAETQKQMQAGHDWAQKQQNQNK